MRKELIKDEEINSEIIKRIDILENCDAKDKSRFSIKDYIVTLVIIVITLALIIYGAFL